MRGTSGRRREAVPQLRPPLPPMLLLLPPRTIMGGRRQAQGVVVVAAAGAAAAIIRRTIRSNTTATPPAPMQTPLLGRSWRACRRRAAGGLLAPAFLAAHPCPALQRSEEEGEGMATARWPGRPLLLLTEMQTTLGLAKRLADEFF